jgi:hypothetical protein
MGRALMIPAFVGKNIKKWVAEDKLPVDIKKYGDVPERIFITTETLRSTFGKEFDRIPWGAVAMYTFADRLKLGLQQLMAGARKFGLQHIDRNDVVSLTREAADVTGIPYVMESDMKEAERILLG